MKKVKILMVKFSEKRNQHFLVVQGPDGIGTIWLTKATEEGIATLLGSVEVVPGIEAQATAYELEVKLLGVEDGYPRYEFVKAHKLAAK